VLASGILPLAYPPWEFRVSKNATQGTDAPLYFLPLPQLRQGVITQHSNITPPANQDHIANVVVPKLYEKLPPAIRPTLIKGNSTDALPVHSEFLPGPGGVFVIPDLGWSLSFIANQGSGNVAPLLEGYHIKGAVMTFLPGIDGFEVSSFLQEFLSRYVAPGQGLVQEKFNFKSCLHELYRTDFLTGADLLLLYYPTTHTPGSKVSRYWILN
jgi:hypothetical protein